MELESSQTSPGFEMQGGETLDSLRARLQKVKSIRASLQADISRTRNAPSIEEIHAASMAAQHPLPPHVAELSKQVNVAEDQCILHRTSGWTVFEIDLDTSRRERWQRSMEGPSKMGKGSLGLGVRLETFWRGRFYEPYYLVFAKQSQLLEGTAQVMGAALDAGLHDARWQSEEKEEEEEEMGDRQPVRLIRHTIPHFIPLQTLVRRHLGRGGFVSRRKRGGFDLLDGLLDREGLYDFLGHLHVYLQAFVSRREQAVSLRLLHLPGAAASKLDAYGNDAFDQISISWSMPKITPQDVIDYERSEGIDRSFIDNNPGLRQRIQWKRTYSDKMLRRLERQGRGGNRAISIVLHLTNLRTDRVGEPREHQPRDMLSTEDGLLCADGSLKVEVMRTYSAYNSKEARKKNSMGERVLTQTRTKTTRRKDFEEMLAREKVDLDAAVGHVLSAIYRDQVKVMSERERRFLQPRKPRGMLPHPDDSPEE